MTKPSFDSWATLGLKLQKNIETEELVFQRGNQIPPVVDELNKWELFSTCEKLVGHYPVAAWLRIACSYLKKQHREDRWDD